MSKQTIIDWQKDSLLIARGSGRGGKFVLDDVCLKRVGETEDGKTVSSTQALREGCAQLGLKGDVTVIASREIVEVRTLSVPRIDPDELPDVIRFQAQRQLSNMSEGWALDYVMLPPTPGQEMQTALVGGISPIHLAEIDKACTAAGLQVTRIVLRPIEIARYAVETGSLSSSGASMIVCIARQSADLLIIRAGLVLQVRSTRLPSEASGIAAVLKGEIRRSLMAASAQLSNIPLESVLLLSTNEIAQHLDGVIAEASSASVVHVDPTTMLPSDLEERDAIADQYVHRLAAVAGAISAENTPKQLLIDFKNPKKRPPKKKNTGRLLLYGGAAAILLIAGIGWWIVTNRGLDQDIAHYRAQTAEKAEVVAWAKEKVKDLNEVQKFLDSSPNWLDELAYISNRIPEADKVILESPVFTTQPRDGTALIRVPVRANESGSIGEFERSLRDENHVIQGSDPAEIPQASDGYKWRVVESITIKGRGWNVFGAKADLGTSTAATESAADTSEVAEADTPSEEEAAEDVPVEGNTVEASSAEADKAEETQPTVAAEPEANADNAVEGAATTSPAASEDVADESQPEPPVATEAVGDNGAAEVDAVEESSKEAEQAEEVNEVVPSEDKPKT